MAARLPLVSTWMAMPPLQRNTTPHHYWPTAKPVSREDVSGSRTFSMASLVFIMSVTCAQCEPAFICEEHGGTSGKFANYGVLPILIPCTVSACRHNPYLWMSGPHTTLMKSVSEFLSRHLHICGAPMFILQGSGSAFFVPPCTKAEVGRCCCWVVAFLRPFPCLLIYLPVSWYYLHIWSLRWQTFCHSSHCCANLDKMHFLSPQLGCRLHLKLPL